MRNIDISFEKDFVPNIFPLGSQNGGGKSTLLQLIFVLLHCSGDSSKHEYIKNMLHGFEIDDESQKRVLAKFDIWDGEKTVNLEFVAYKYLDVNELFISSGEKLSYNSDFLEDDDDFYLLPAHKRIKENNYKIKELESETASYYNILEYLQNIQKIENIHDREYQLRNLESKAKILNTSHDLRK